LTLKFFLTTLSHADESAIDGDITGIMKRVTGAPLGLTGGVTGTVTKTVTTATPGVIGMEGFVVSGVST
jgi:hypothetical protein